MQNFIASIILVFCLCITNNAQAIAYYTNPQQEAEKILSDIYTAVGNTTITKPTIEIRNTTTHVAAYDPTYHVIVLENQAIAVCQTMPNPKNALAFLIGHELTHAFQKHHKEQSNFLAYNKSFNSNTRMEQTADVQGAFMAYLAGYPMASIPDLIDNLYKMYGLDGKSIPNYPNKKERKNTAIIVQQDANRLVSIFETGNYLMLMQQYYAATCCYKEILNYYEGKEIYNNLGVAHALYALNFSEENIDEFVYPIEIDTESRLKKKKSLAGGKDLSLIEKKERAEHLNLAFSYFKNAKNTDKDYVIADINILCVLDLQDKYQEALQFYQDNDLAQHSQYVSNPKEADRALLVFTIIKAKNAKKNEKPIDFEQCKNIFNQLKNSHYSDIAQNATMNLAIAQGKNLQLKPIFFKNTTTTNAQNMHVLLQGEKCTIQIMLLPTNNVAVQVKIEGQNPFRFDIKKQVAELKKPDDCLYFAASTQQLMLCRKCQCIYKMNQEGKITEIVQF